jgi:hypothetical protein
MFCSSKQPSHVHFDSYILADILSQTYRPENTTKKNTKDRTWGNCFLADIPQHVRGASISPPPEITTERLQRPKLGPHIFIPLHCRKNQLDLAQDHLCGDENAPNMVDGAAVRSQGNFPYHDVA